MKICKNCGKEVEDNAKFCTSCGQKVLVEENNTISEGQNNNHPFQNLLKFDSKSRMIYFILSMAFAVPGFILLIIFGIKELNFQTDYDLSGLTDAAIDVLRDLTGNESNISLIIVGVVLFIIGAVISLPMIINAAKNGREKK